tara:strand:+ start:20 stop:457 length:438 start_codon:yes stop_codon:yes gene_type:complete
MDIVFKKAEEIYLPQIVELLQVISNFYPDSSELKLIWQTFNSQKGVFTITAIDKDIIEIDNQLVGFGSLHLTKKIRGGIIGFIEDISIKEEYRKKGIGKSILKKLINKAKSEGCYKVVLDCKEETKTFYQNIGFNHSGNSMTIFF